MWDKKYLFGVKRHIFHLFFNPFATIIHHLAPLFKRKIVISQRYNYSQMKKILLFILSLIVSTISLNVKADIREYIKLSSSDELYCMHFDHNGLLWLGTSSGIKSYDGYVVRNEFTRNVPAFPQLISDIRSITTDNDNHLWAGTNNGLLRIDLSSGNIHHYTFPKQSQQIIYKLFTSSKGIVYVGTDDGFSIYDSKKGTFRHYNQDNAKAIYPNGKKGKYTGWGVKDFVETKNGDIIIGTWSQGMWRYSPKTGQIRGYEKTNWMNSAYALCIDKSGRLWIGSQGYNVQRLENVNDYKVKTATYDIFKGKQVVYDIVELPNNNMYVCTGDTIGAEIGPDGALWLATRENGIIRSLSDRNIFSTHAAGSIRSLYTANGLQFYFGYGMAGLAWYDMANGAFKLNNMIPGYTAIPTGLITRVTSIVRRYNGDIWAAAGDNGIFISHADGTSETVYSHSRQMPYVRDNVTALYEDTRSKTLWIGQRKGISLLLANDKGEALTYKDKTIDLTGYFMVNHITADHNGNIWVSSANSGIVRISGNPRNSKSLKYKHFNTPFTNITACYEDSKHRLWAICSGGLMMYDKENDNFKMVNKSFHLYDRAVMAINEDAYGCLWLATDRALVRLDEDGNTISFTEQDGLPSTSFFANSTFRYGDRMFFGTNNGFIDFKPAKSYQGYRNFKSNIVVTDITIDGSSILALDSAEMEAISKHRPMMTKEIYIPASVRKFGIEFALLNYANQKETQYAYKLEGYDNEWQYVDGTTHFANYDHLSAGKYTFHLKAADCHGHWSDMPYTITVRVAAPWYDTWWAYLLYIIILAALGRMLWKYLQIQREMEASRRFSTILQSAQINNEETKAETENEKKAEEQQETELSPAAIKAQAAQQKDAQFIAKATQLVNDHIDDADYNRESMAADLNMSVSTLYGRMRDCTGLSIQTFIQTIRLNTAAEILTKEPYIRINELAYRVGFNTPKYFSQCFKKKFGVLPGEYIK